MYARVLVPRSVARLSLVQLGGDSFMERSRAVQVRSRVGAHHVMAQDSTPSQAQGIFDVCVLLQAAKSQSVSKMDRGSGRLEKAQSKFHRRLPPGRGQRLPLIFWGRVWPRPTSERLNAYSKMERNG